MHGARKDVSTGYVLRGWTCFLEELTQDCLPRAVSNGASQIVHRSGQRQIWLGELSELTSQKGDCWNIWIDKR